MQWSRTRLPIAVVWTPKIQTAFVEAGCDSWNKQTGLDLLIPMGPWVEGNFTIGPGMVHVDAISSLDRPCTKVEVRDNEILGAPVFMHPSAPLEVLVHEFGHVLGLVHHENLDCVMDSLARALTPCGRCLRWLHEAYNGIQDGGDSGSSMRA